MTIVEKLEKIDEAASEWFNKRNHTDVLKGVREGNLPDRYWMMFFLLFNRIRDSFMNPLTQIILIKEAYSDWEKKTVVSGSGPDAKDNADEIPFAAEADALRTAIFSTGETPVE